MKCICVLWRQNQLLILLWSCSEVIIASQLRDGIITCMKYDNMLKNGVIDYIRRFQTWSPEWCLDFRRNLHFTYEKMQQDIHHSHTFTITHKSAKRSSEGGTACMRQDITYKLCSRDHMFLFTDCPQQLTRTFVFSHTASLDNFRRLSGVQCVSASSFNDLWYIAGKPLQLHLQACDVKSKEEKSGPDNMLTETSTGDGTTETTNSKSLVVSTVWTCPLSSITESLFLLRFSHRERQEESQCDPVDRGPEQLPGHSDEDQSEAPHDFTECVITQTVMEDYCT